MEPQEMNELHLKLTALQLAVQSYGEQERVQSIHMNNTDVLVARAQAFLDFLNKKQ